MSFNAAIISVVTDDRYVIQFPSTIVSIDGHLFSIENIDINLLSCFKNNL